jgi:hypothetical protein
MLYRALVFVYCDNRIEYLNMLYELSAEILMLKQGYTQ